jgi:hypothetical protein
MFTIYSFFDIVNFLNGLISSFIMRKFVVFGMIALLGMGVGYGLLNAKEKDDIPISPNSRIPTGHSVAPVYRDVGYHNLEEFLSSKDFVQDVPNDFTIMLRLYNFNSGNREWEKDFIITRGDVREGYSYDPDLTVNIHSKYLDEMNVNNFCSIMRKAKKNGDFDFHYTMGDASMAWKLKGMLKYKDCFGF